jgi:molybdopterin synthase sulfur carrier subunit
MTVVRLPSPLYAYTNGKAEVKAAGGTLTELLSDLDRSFPGLRFRVVDEQDRIRPTILFHVNGRVVRDLGEKVDANDEVQIVAALSGG